MLKAVIDFSCGWTEEPGVKQGLFMSGKGKREVNTRSMVRIENRERSDPNLMIWVGFERKISNNRTQILTGLVDMGYVTSRLINLLVDLGYVTRRLIHLLVD